MPTLQTARTCSNSFIAPIACLPRWSMTGQHSLDVNPEVLCAVFVPTETSGLDANGINRKYGSFGVVGFSRPQTMCTRQIIPRQGCQEQPRLAALVRRVMQ